MYKVYIKIAPNIAILNRHECHCPYQGQPTDPFSRRKQLQRELQVAQRTAMPAWMSIDSKQG
jgi:hypothetical protein